MDGIFKEIDRLQDEINRLRPLGAFHFKQVRDYYRIGLTYSSNAIEGNSLTETETKIVLEEGMTIGGKPLIDHYEAVGHSDAYDRLYKQAKSKSISEKQIKELHKLFYRRISDKDAGKYRKSKVIITGSKYPCPPPQTIPGLMKTFVEQLSESRGNMHPVTFAAKSHKDLAFIHPFIDGNGRVCRLLMNLILLQEGYNIAVIPPVVRKDYFESLERAHTDDTLFIEFIARTVRETQKDYLRLFSD